jgi:hypothetical protein
MYTFNKYPLEAIRGRAPEYVAIGHVGHGINSYAITYQLVYGPVACFVQSAWGGAYMDRVAATFETREKLDKCSKLVELAERATNSMPRLLVIEAQFTEIQLCEWLPSLWDTYGARRWLDDRRQSCSDPLSRGIGLLSKLN